MNLVKAYSNLLITKPYTTKTATTCFMFGLGNVLQQTFFETPKESVSKYQLEQEIRFGKEGSMLHRIDFRKTMHFAFMGLVMGPVFHNWYHYLDRVSTMGVFKNFKPFKRAFGTMCMDSFMFTPVVNCWFFTCFSLLETQGFQQGIDNIQNKLWTLLKTNWMIWPAAQMINFLLIPLEFRVVWVNCVGLCWNIILSYITNSSIEKQPQQSS